MSDELVREEETEEYAEDMAQRLALSIIPHVTIDVRVRMPGRTNYVKVIAGAEAFLTHEQVYDMLQAALNFHKRNLHNRERRVKSIGEKVPKTHYVYKFAARLCVKAKTRINWLEEVLQWRDSSTFKHFYPIGWMRWYKDWSEVERRMKEYDEYQEAREHEEESVSEGRSVPGA